MQTGYFLLFLSFSLSLEACCVGNQQNSRSGLQQNTTHQGYKAVEGEIFMMPCPKEVNQHTEVVWSRIGEGRAEKGSPSFACGTEFLVEAKYSGRYTCCESGSKLFLHLQVVKRKSLACFSDEESSVDLIVGLGVKIPCPGLNCSDNSDVRWFMGKRAKSEQPKASSQENGELYISGVRDSHTGVYFCDRQVIEGGFKWTFRRAVNITAVPHLAPNRPPDILDPDSNMTKAAVLGLSHSLICTVNFPFEKKFSPDVRWLMHYGGNTTTTTVLHIEKTIQDPRFQDITVSQISVIKEVTSEHFNNTYTCIATNIVGNSSVTIKLKEKYRVKWPSVVGYPIVLLLLVAGVGICLHVKWLELQLIYKSYLQQGKHDGDEKDFDVFLSFVWSGLPVEAAEVSAFYQTGPDTDVEEYLSPTDPLSSDEGEVTQKPLEVLLPRVLEDLWGYRLCLLERDVLPGGAYTNDVVHAIQRSQMLICLLSADYLSNNSAVFVLESGVQALLQNSSPKLLLLWTNGESASRLKPDPRLPVLVQRALKVLPSLDWTSGKPFRTRRNFWESLLKAMPNHKKDLHR
ncbi:interleukin-18 receptor accessory protein-like isoform X1 [Xyrichtys novacula]|uniref:Interleukin-18 receptor accessory protein-like isoform X1 n=1 Tax=Xyrichtys novacula TaxID=13765 RepID=A0AAV1ELH4_XYRNO|nr:interleukin-18 receptor accessory protein-like isoform X1 [Xyrichtys novacula]